MSEGQNGSDEEEEEDALLVEAGCWFWTIAEGLKAFVVSESTNHSKRIGFLPSSYINKFKNDGDNKHASRKMTISYNCSLVLIKMLNT